MQSMGLTDRNQAKTAIYCMIYGGGNQRLGEIAGAGAAEGRIIRDRFYKANPAFADLLRQVKKVAANRGYLIGLDGRQLAIRSEHGALNVLLQSCAAILAKQWVHLIDQEIKRQESLQPSSRLYTMRFKFQYNNNKKEWQIMSVHSLDEWRQKRDELSISVSLSEQNTASDEHGQTLTDEDAEHIAAVYAVVQSSKNQTIYNQV